MSVLAIVTKLQFIEYWEIIEKMIFPGLELKPQRRFGY